MNLPSYETHTSYFGNGFMPHIITLRPLQRPGQLIPLDSILETVSFTIQNIVVQQVRRFNGWSREMSLQRVRGRLIATNVINGTVHAFTSQFIFLEEIIPGSIESIVQSIQQSNETLTVSDIEWAFHIDPRSITEGGSSKIKVPSWAPYLKFRKTWTGYPGVNCAAFSLCYLMYSSERRYRDLPLRSYEDAIKLQEEMGWGEMTSISELEIFVQKYDRYKLAVFLPTAASCPFVYVGANYEEERNGKRCPKNLLYLVYDPEQKHFAATKSPGQILQTIHNDKTLLWCHHCFVKFRQEQEHICPEHQRQKKRRKNYPCLKCGILGEHQCELITCKFCSGIYKKKEGFDHRCILNKEERKEKKNRFCGELDKENGDLYSLWVYDFESCIVIERSVRQLICGFRMEENQYAEKEVEIFDFIQEKHEVNYAACKNVFTGEEKEFFGENALTDFILFLLTFNQGKNICIAHNASGYDTRLLFSKCKDLHQKVSMSPIMRGGKFMQLKVNKDLIFRDSLLHVKGSLKALAKDFCFGLMEKGHFPHLFNTKENYSYSGRIPEKKYFDISFSARSEKDVEEFDRWYDSFQGEWNFMEQLKLYCKNDVAVLCEIVRGYHEIAMEKFQMSPWFNATAPSFVHEVFLARLTKGLDLPNPKTDNRLYLETIKNLAKNEFWAVLKPTEYWFAREALRGGRTDIRKILHKVSDEDWARGVRIRYQDICSQYPYQQVVHDFPVGLPKVFIWNYKYLPCKYHQNQIKCDCGLESIDQYCDVIVKRQQWTVEEIVSDPNFFGIVCATLVPPKNMYHPVLVGFDEKLNKCVASCEIIKEGVFTSVEFIKALQMGYTLIHIHRYDEYKKKPSLWRDTILDLFLEKMMNSKAAPEGDARERLVREYSLAFGNEFGEKIQESIEKGKWGKNPAKKQTAKIMMNSAWGKHAQRPVMPEAQIFNFDEDEDKIYNFFENCVAQNFEYHDGVYLNEKQIMYKYSVSGNNTRPDLHGGYLPAALFVPAYGRLHLWEQLDRLGKRVLMNDTDSIVYIYDPDQYNIPEGGLLGMWEVEDVDKDHGGIREFVGLGPKTYGIKCDDGFEMVKAKGLSLNYGTKGLVNFDRMKDIAKKKYVLKVPQKTFVWNIKDGMKNWYMMKDLKLNVEELKGELKEDGCLYPFGYSE